MTCSGCLKKFLVQKNSQDENVDKIKRYLEYRKQHKCLYCGGILKIYPGGIVICMKCRKRKQ